jgi:hypothetical protein
MCGFDLLDRVSKLVNGVTGENEGGSEQAEGAPLPFFVKDWLVLFGYNRP